MKHFMSNEKQIINGMTKHIFCKAALILITEELRILFTASTGSSNRKYRVFVGFQENEKTNIITYDNTKNQLLRLSMNDAIKTILFQEEDIELPSSNNTERQIHNYVDQICNSVNPIYDSKSDSNYIPYSLENRKKGFYVMVAYNSTEWEDKRIPVDLIDQFFSYFKQNINFLSQEQTSSMRLSTSINQIFNPTIIIRKVCEKRLKELFGNKKEIRDGELFDFVCNLACKTYEGSSNKGVIRFVSDKYKIPYLLQFEKIVPCIIENAREIRKLLEMTDKNIPLLVKDHQIVGLGMQGASRYSISFEGNGKWKLLPNEKDSPVFTVEGGICTFTGSNNELEFSDVFTSTFPDYKDYCCKVKAIIDSAKKQKHGTSIVICSDAEKEANRLFNKARAIKIAPISLVDNKAINNLTSIDGAIIISPEGKCYAIGAILDGEATIKGDTARGARYNSLCNYVAWRKENSKECNVMAVVISEDQTVDYLPNFKASSMENDIRNNKNSLRSPYMPKEVVNQ